MLDGIDDVDLRLRFIEAAEKIHAFQLGPEMVDTVRKVRGLVYDAAVAMRDGVGYVNYGFIHELASRMGFAAVTTWCLACSALLGPLRPEILDDLADCGDQFAWPIQLPAAREALYPLDVRQRQRREVGQCLRRAVSWHRRWSAEGPVPALLGHLVDTAPRHGMYLPSDFRRQTAELAVGLHLLTSWYVRVTPLPTGPPGDNGVPGEATPLPTTATPRHQEQQ